MFEISAIEVLGFVYIFIFNKFEVKVHWPKEESH